MDDAIEATEQAQGESPAMAVPCAQCGRPQRDHALVAANVAPGHVLICPRSVYTPET